MTLLRYSLPQHRRHQDPVRAHLSRRGGRRGPDRRRADQHRRSPFPPSVVWPAISTTTSISRSARSRAWAMSTSGRTCPCSIPRWRTSWRPSRGSRRRPARCPSSAWWSSTPPAMPSSPNSAAGRAEWAGPPMSRWAGSSFSTTGSAAGPPEETSSSSTITPRPTSDWRSASVTGSPPRPAPTPSSWSASSTSWSPTCGLRSSWSPGTCPPPGRSFTTEAATTSSTCGCRPEPRWRR